MAEMGWETQLQLLIGFSTEMICRTGQEKFAERFEKPFTRLDLNSRLDNLRYPPLSSRLERALHCPNRPIRV